MATPRKPKIKPFSWADLGLTKPLGEALEAAGCTPVQAAKIVAVPNPSWTGAIAGAFARGYLTATEAAALGEGHSLAALKTLEESQKEARQIVLGALSQAAARVDAATKAAANLLVEAQEELLSARRSSALDLSEEVFGSDDGWREILEEEVLRAARFRIRMRIGNDLYVVDQDDDVILVVRNRDAKSWQFSKEGLGDLDASDPDYEGILEPLLEALSKFTFESDDQDLEGDLAVMLRQHRARCALEKLRAPNADSGLQLMLDL